MSNENFSLCVTVGSNLHCGVSCNGCILIRCLFSPLCCADVIWVILSVEEGGLLGVTQQLSSFETEFNTQPHRSLEGDFNPFASPQKNKQDTNEDHLKDPGGPWDAPLDSIQQDQNGLTHSSVNITPNGLQNNLSVVTYSQVCMQCLSVCWVSS